MSDLYEVNVIAHSRCSIPPFHFTTSVSTGLALSYPSDEATSLSCKISKRCNHDIHDTYEPQVLHGVLMIMSWLTMATSWLSWLLTTIMVSHDPLMTDTPPMHSLLSHMHMFDTWTTMHSFRMFPLFFFFSSIYSSSFYLISFPIHP